MPHALSARAGARLFREGQWAEARAQEAARQAGRQGEVTEADSWGALVCAGRDQARALRPGGREAGEAVSAPDQCGAEP
jgi:hypothetical protein